jgi:tRNA(adenine34) deaminase
MNFEKYMRMALELAEEAFEAGEVPVGCVIADEAGEVIGSGRNRREENSDATAHAELEAIKQACIARCTWRLEGCALFVTLEPCPMCAGAIIQSRIKKVFIGTPDPKSGAVGSILNLFEYNNFNHKVEYEYGILTLDCSNILKEFFKKLRTEKSKLKTPKK